MKPVTLMVMLLGLLAGNLVWAQSGPVRSSPVVVVAQEPAEAPDASDGEGQPERPPLPPRHEP